MSSKYIREIFAAAKKSMQDSSGFICVAFFFVLSALCMLYPLSVVVHPVKFFDKLKPELKNNVINDQIVNRFDKQTMALHQEIKSMKTAVDAMKKRKQMTDDDEGSYESSDESSDDIVEEPRMKLKWPGPIAVENFVHFSEQTSEMMVGLAEAITNHINSHANSTSVED